MENGRFIDGLPINSMVIFHGYVSHNQMVYYSLSGTACLWVCLIALVELKNRVVTGSTLLDQNGAGIRV